MTKQELFDTVARGLIAQGEPSITGSTCAYRFTKPDGKVLKCAAGQLIPDALYVAGIENNTVSSFNDIKGDPEHGIVAKFFVAIVGRENMDALRHLQTLHDIPVFNQHSEQVAARNAKPYSDLPLQTVIDGERWQREWRDGMIEYANTYGLNTAALSDLHLGTARSTPNAYSY